MSSVMLEHRAYPPLNFRVRSLVETHHVVQKRTVGDSRRPISHPSSDFIDERKTGKEVPFSGFNFSVFITV